MAPIAAVDMFCGTGGASIGLHEAGVCLEGAVDIDEAAIQGYLSNPLDKRPFQADLRDVDFFRISNHYAFSMDSVDLLIGCPPCQNFSTLRDTKPWPEDEPKDELLLTFYQHIRELRPRFVIFENVPGIFTSDNGQYLKWLKKRMRELGYGMKMGLLDAADFGVPQRRVRTIGIFALGFDNEEICFPTPTHGDQSSNRLPYVTVRDAISDLPKLDAGEQWDDDPAHRARNHQESTLEILEAVPKDGGSRTDIEDEDLILDCHKRLDSSTSAGNIYGRMSWDQPAPTLTTRCTTPSCGRFIHPEQNRGITFREAARLMGFPDFPLPAKNSEAEKIIGNAVPPQLVEHVVRQSILPLN